MENKKFSLKIDSLECQFKELTHLIDIFLKNQSPTSSTQESHASSQVKEKLSPSSESIPESYIAYSKPPKPLVFFTRNHRQSNG